MNNNNSAADIAASSTTSEYRIGHTTYIVKTVFNPVYRESLSDILNRLIIRDTENFLGENKQVPDKQAV